MGAIVQLDKKAKRVLTKLLRQSRAAMTPEERQNSDSTQEILDLSLSIRKVLERKGIWDRTVHQAIVTVVADAIKAGQLRAVFQKLAPKPQRGAPGKEDLKEARRLHREEGLTPDQVCFEMGYTSPPERKRIKDNLRSRQRQPKTSAE